MRLLITCVVVLLVACCHARPQDQEYDYEEESQPAEPVTPAPTKPSVRPSNSRQARGPSPLLSRNSKPTPATVKQQEPEVVNEPLDVQDDEEYLDDAVTPSTTTTLAPKKVVAPVVRPFRSNQDLLAALKRRRQQEQQGGTVSTHATTTTTTTSPADKPPRNSNTNSNSNNNKRTYNRNKAPAPVQEITQEAEVTRKPVTNSAFSRRFTSRASKITTAAPAVADVDDVEEAEEPAPRAAKSYRGGRRS